MKNYDSNQVKLTIGNRPINSGRAEGEFVTTEMAAPLNTRTVGADGEVTVSKSNNQSGTLKVKLLQTSDGHRLLSQLYAVAVVTPGTTAMAFELRDIAGGLLEHGSCWFEQAPPSSYGAVASEREWTFGVDKLTREVV